LEGHAPGVAQEGHLVPGRRGRHVAGGGHPGRQQPPERAGHVGRPEGDVEDERILRPVIGQRRLGVRVQLNDDPPRRVGQEVGERRLGQGAHDAHA
jgi:hypothetical protein